MCFRPGLKFLISQSEGQTSRIYSGRPISKSQTSAARPNASKLVGSAQCASSKIISIGFLPANISMAGAFIFAGPEVFTYFTNTITNSNPRKYTSIEYSNNN